MDVKKIIGIAACDPKGVIGKNGNLPWHCPEDLKHFADTILNYPIVMGYRTFLSLPNHYFDTRIGIVFVYQKPLVNKNPNLFFVSSLAEFFSIENFFKKLYIVGGGEIYSLFLKENLISEFILTHLKESYDGDTFFPLGLLKDWSYIQIRETPDFIICRYFNLSLSCISLILANQ